MADKKWSSRNIYALLRAIDNGYQPTEEERAMLSGRKRLYLTGTNISSLPESIGLLSSLQSLDLSDTPITALPESFGQLSGLQSLNLRGIKITALPESFGQLKNLQTLDLFGTLIFALPETFGQFSNLQTLDLRGTKITDLPDSFRLLSSLQSLTLSYSSITNLPESFGQLNSLQSLDLCDTQITDLPDSFGELKNLQVLDLRSTPITDLPDSFGQLNCLQSLDLCDTQITDLPGSFGELKNLQVLDLRSTPITDLPDSFGQLNSLQSLDLCDTQITDLPGSFGQLSSLQNLDLSYSTITALPDSFGQLPSLQNLDLSHSAITDLPDSFGQLPSLQYLFLNDTPITALPKKLALGSLPIIHQDSGEIPGIYADGTNLPDEYFADKEVLSKYLEQGEKRRFREAKIIFLGDGNAGKTFTVTRICKGGKQEPKKGPPYSPSQTHGVKPYDYSVPGTGLTLHLWDFGGQEMFHAMHRCFLTRNTVYVLMVSTRDSEHTRRLRYWLHSIRSFAKGSTVTVIVNNFDDEGRADVDKISLKNEFKTDLTLEFVELSAKDATKQVFTKKIMNPLIALAEQADENFGLHPAAYMRVKDRIRQALKNAYKEKKQGYIGADAYIQACTEENITDPMEQAALLRYFTDLGVCFSIIPPEKDAVPKDCRLIEPVWLTNALYAIIEECRPVRGWVGMDAIKHCLGNHPGKGRSKDYVRVAPELRYDPGDCAYVLRVAEEFSLVYRDSEEPGSVFLPAMCNYTDRPEQIERPDDPPYRVVYEVEYPYLSETVVQKLMVDCLLEGYKKQTTCWRGGFRLEGQGFAGVIDTAAEDRALRIDLWSTSAEQPVRELLRWFREKLGLPDRDRKEYIIYNENRFSVQRLLNSENNELYEIVGDTGPRLNVRMLLGAFPEQYDREQGGTSITVNGPYIDQRKSRGQQVINYGDHAKITVSFADRGTDLSWNRFKANYHNTPVEFEHLCTDLFRLEYFDRQTVFQSDPNNPGVEIHPKEALRGDYCGQPISFQSKFFDGPVKYDDIMGSAKKTVENYSGKMAACYLYCNKNLTKKSYAPIEALLIAAGITLELVVGGALLDRIREYPELVERYFYK